MAAKPKIIFRWSEREKDWFVQWPANAGAKPNAGLIMDHMTHAKTAYGTTLVEELASRAVNLKTLRLTIEVAVTSSSSDAEGNPSAPRGTRDAVSAALEASGIDTANVKGVG